MGNTIGGKAEQGKLWRDMPFAGLFERVARRDTDEFSKTSVGVSKTLSMSSMNKEKRRLLSLFS